MKKIIYILLVVGLFTGCTHREYFKVSSGGTGNVDKDLAQCEYNAEMNVKSNATNTQNVIINQGYHDETKEERKERQKREASLEYEKERKHDSQVQKLTDLCMRSRGWSLKYVDNK